MPILESHKESWDLAKKIPDNQTGYRELFCYI